MRERVRALLLLVGTALRADPLRAGATLAITLLESCTRASRPYILKVFTDGVVEGRMTRVVIASVAYGTSLAMLGITNLARINWGTVLQEKTAFLLDQQLIELTAGVPTIEHHERSDYLDKMQLLRTQRGMLAGTVQALISNTQMLTQLIIFVALLGNVHPILLFLPLFGLPSLFTTAKASIIRQRSFEVTAERTRVADHLLQLATTAAPGKELRIFGLGDEIASRHDEIWADYDRLASRAALRATLLHAVGATVFALGYVGCLVFVVVRAVRHPGDVTAGDVLLTFNIAAQINHFVAAVAGGIGWLSQCLRSIGGLLWLRDYASEAIAASSPDEPAVAPAALATGIRLDHVTFTYPGTDHVVLDDISVDLPAGATVAVVGENGAGKTTLIKLLCSLYRPTSGTISIDGVPLDAFEVPAWRERIASGFQDFAKLELIARESIGVGDLPAMGAEDEVSAALERARVSELVDVLPAGLATQLGKSFTDGVELSIGQWQKVALGRTMMRSTPLLLVLDEPTASLDAQTEHALFERYSGAARRLAVGTGGITVLVSHRFSTVRMADLIIVLDQGRILDVGAHDELMQRAGLYAELYDLQARAYR